MLKTCEGLYRDGVVVLDEQPEGLDPGKVLVTFLPADNTTKIAQDKINVLDQALNQARSLFKHIPASRVLSDELIAERRKEASDE